MNELLKKIDYALRKDSLCDSERIASARFLIAQALPGVAQAAVYPDPQTVEACAAVVEDFPETILEFWERPGGPPGNGYRSVTRKDLAAAIRSIEAVGSPLSSTDRAAPPSVALEAREALEKARDFIDPDRDPPRMTNRELVALINAALTRPQPGGAVAGTERGTP